MLYKNISIKATVCSFPLIDLPFIRSGQRAQNLEKTSTHLGSHSAAPHGGFHPPAKTGRQSCLSFMVGIWHKRREPIRKGATAVLLRVYTVSSRKAKLLPDWATSAVVPFTDSELGSCP